MLTITTVWLAIGIRMSCCYAPEAKKIRVDQMISAQFSTARAASEFCQKFRGSQEACFVIEVRPGSSPTK